MNEKYMLQASMLSQQNNRLEIIKCNEYTVRYGLELKAEDINSLVESRAESLQRAGRIEFGKSILPKLIMEFSDSSYVRPDNYLETLQELQEMFYYFKNESYEELTDDELIHIMREYFERECQGSIDLLQEKTLDEICRCVRAGDKDFKNREI